MFPIQNPLQWIAGAFKLRLGQSPNELYPNVQPTFDVLQGGMGQVEWEQLTFTSGIAAPQNIRIAPVVGTVTGDKFGRIYQISGTNNGVVLCLINVRHFLNSTVSPTIQMFQNLPAGGSLPWSTISGGLLWGFCPAGFTLAIDVGAPSAGTTTEIQVTIGKIPGGIKGW